MPKKAQSEEERMRRVRANKAKYRNSSKGIAAQAAYYERAREKLLVRMRERMLSEYGLNIDEYDSLLMKQNNRCAICRIHISECKRRFAVDHNHKTEDVRGLLCFRCNAGVGKFEDDAELLKLAVKYLEVHDGTSGIRTYSGQVPDSQRPKNGQDDEFEGR